MLWYKRKNYLVGKASRKVRTGHFRARSRQNMREEVEMVTTKWTDRTEMRPLLELQKTTLARGRCSEH